MISGTVVLVHGCLKGQGYQAECDVLARRVEFLDGNNTEPAFTYTQCSLIGAPINIPDGAYEVLFDGFEIAQVLHDGLWSSHGEAHKIGPQNQWPSVWDSPKSTEVFSPRTAGEKRGNR